MFLGQGIPTLTSSSGIYLGLWDRVLGRRPHNRSSIPIFRLTSGGFFSAGTLRLVNIDRKCAILSAVHTSWPPVGCGHKPSLCIPYVDGRSLFPGTRKMVSGSHFVAAVSLLVAFLTYFLISRLGLIGASFSIWLWQDFRLVGSRSAGTSRCLLAD